MKYKASIVLLALAAAHSTRTNAGSYFGVNQFIRSTSGAPNPITAAAIMHPPGYTGSGGALNVPVCVEAAPQLVGPTQRAIATWNELAPTLLNCTGTNNCEVWEEIPTASLGPMDAESVLLHEIGHCIGLDHVNMREESALPFGNFTGRCDLDTSLCCNEWTSFAPVVNASEILNTNGLRGDHLDLAVNECPSTFTDLAPVEGLTCSATQGVPCAAPPECCPSPPPPVPLSPINITWFRDDDNDPFAVDNGQIDSLYFTRVLSRLPAGHLGPRAANRLVAESMGSPATQAAMYGLVTRGSHVRGLTADDTNMLRMGMSGADRSANTADDYRVVLQYRGSCVGAAIKVRFTPIPSAGRCVANAQLSFGSQGPVPIHWSLIPVTPSTTLFVDIDSDAIDPWDFGPGLFLSGMENGDLSEWSEYSE